MSRSKTKRKPKRPRRYRNSMPDKGASENAPKLDGNQPHCFQLGLNNYHKGNLEAARQSFLETLRSNPEHVESWHLLGLTLRRLGFLDSATECLLKARQLSPQHVDVLRHLAIVYRDQHQWESALETIDASIQLRPDCPSALNIRGAILLESGEVQQAENLFRQILHKHPGESDTAMNLGNLLQQQGQLLDAIEVYNAALKLSPQNALVQLNLCEALRGLGRWQEAIDRLRTLLERQPDFSIARINLARCLSQVGQHAAAKLEFEQVLAAEPQNGKALHYLGKLELETGSLADAEQRLLQAAEVETDDPYIRCTLGHLYSDTNRLAEAETWLREALEVAPELHEAQSGLLFVLSGQAELSPAKLFQQHRTWGQRFSDAAQFSFEQHDRCKNRRLRIGYVSPDFRLHAVASYILPVLRCHDSDLFEVYCYAELHQSDDTSDRFRQQADHWLNTKGLSHSQLAQRIHDDQIDLLIDLAGHTRGNRLPVFAMRPAPVQLTWLGYPHTTGLDVIDFRITCAVQNPAEEPDEHTEQLLRLPHGSFCFSPPDSGTEIKPPPLEHNNWITFGSLHRPFKINSEVIRCWAKVLAAVDNSRLFLFNTKFSGQFIERTRAQFAALGIGNERIDIRNQLTRRSFLELYHDIDVALDVFPWAGGTTTLEALWMGVPVIGNLGDRRSSRSTAAILHHVGHPELVADSEDAYVQLAQSLADDPQRILAYRDSLRDAVQATVANAPRFTRSLESELRQVWHRWCEPIGR